MMTDTDDDRNASEDPKNTWRYREGEDGHPTYVQDSEMDVAVEFNRPDGADPSEGTLTYLHAGESITISPGDTIIGPDGEDVVTVTGYNVTVEPYLSVTAYVDLPPEDGGNVPYSPHNFAARFLGYEDRDGFHFHIGECTAAQGDELERERWADTVGTLRSLEVGDTILWGDRSQPLTVTDTWGIIRSVTVEGPRGATYFIEWSDGDVPVIKQRGGRSLGHPHDLTVVSRAD